MFFTEYTKIMSVATIKTSCTLQADITHGTIIHYDITAAAKLYKQTIYYLKVAVVFICMLILYFINDV